MSFDRITRLQQRQVSIACVVPVHNEAGNIVAFLSELDKKLAVLAEQYEMIMVDDGSQDETVLLAQPMVARTKLRILQFSRNFGKEAALTAGLMQVRSEICILIDADFQHPLATIDAFLAQWAQGYDMVYGVRESRQDEALLKRWLSQIFYRLLKAITNVKIPPHAGDFRLLDRCVVKALNALPERERFMKGLYAWVGFRSIAVPFTVQARQSGKSSWHFNSLLELAIVGITSFSNIPLRVFSLLGFIISLVAFIYGSIIVFDTLITGIEVPGFATLAVAIMFFGGIQLLSIGILGEYVARIFNEVKQRPIYIVANKIGFNDGE